MSHWVLLTLGMVDAPLRNAWEKRYLPKDEWVKQTADDIEKLGNMNPTNWGFLLAREQPANGTMAAIHLTKSVDWELSQALDSNPKLAALKTKDPERHKELSEHCYNLLQTILRQEMQNKLALLLLREDDETISELSSEENDRVQTLIETLEEKTPALLSPLQLFVEDRMDQVLAADNPALVNFRALPAKTQAIARQEIITALGWDEFYAKK